jgi:hypothetical protein
LRLAGAGFAVSASSELGAWCGVSAERQKEGDAGSKGKAEAMGGEGRRAASSSGQLSDGEDERKRATERDVSVRRRGLVGNSSRFFFERRLYNPHKFQSLDTIPI